MSEGVRTVASLRLLLLSEGQGGECEEIQQEGREVAKVADLQGLGPVRRKER